MKTAIILFVISLNISLAYGQGALSIQVKNINGGKTTIAETTQAEFIVLDFWATWCKPCIKSIPKLVELSKKYRPEKLSFVGVNVDSPRNTNKIKPTVNTLNISYPVVLDADQAVMSELMVSSLPTLIVLNRKGKVLFLHEGYVSGDEVDIEKELNKLIGK